MRQFTVDTTNPDTSNIVVSPEPCGTNPTVTAKAVDSLTNISAAEFSVGGGGNQTYLVTVDYLAAINFSVVINVDAGILVVVVAGVVLAVVFVVPVLVIV